MRSSVRHATFAALLASALTCSFAGAAPPSACTLESGPLDPLSYVWNAPDAWQLVAWYIPVSPCAACPKGDAATIDSVAFVLRWIDPCSAVVQVSIVGATGGPGCRAPDFGRVLCEPVEYAISGANGAVPYSLALPSGCCIESDAFAVVRFSGLGNCGVNPTAGLRRTAEASVPCMQYIQAPSPYPALTDWSTIKPDALWTAIDAHCCTPVPARPGSWGNLKSRYR